MILVGNWIDQADGTQVSTHEAQEFADEENLPYVEVMTTSGMGVDEMLLTLMRPNPRNVKRAV
eukprot:CAMPEP_0201527190 /NCGR_PEP_ID=MMETSP0161_2-20130828/34317_1 /ASSEMBLY_ACC=CAM_ASM_000251 /TAXON_ID=180227 /ORGANISM="Neoparamoeba aestuarina, Strain SoJaBio B1-5/56/2" /LENGTH=62 /DNA_ID=CAMNT_0047927905 /DNA_START=539 /DNA_END=727 /DNA_ORIENTATION=+